MDSKVLLENSISRFLGVSQKGVRKFKFFGVVIAKLLNDLLEFNFENKK